MSGGAVYAVVMTSLALFVVMWRMAVAVRRLPRAIVTRLRTEPEVRVRTLGAFSGPGQWNPAKPFNFGTLLYGRGRATYTMRDGNVHLRWEPRRGAGQDFEGPIPAHLADARAVEQARRRVRRATGGLALYVAILAAIGLIAGLVTHRLPVTLASVVAGMCVLPLVASGSAIIRRRRERLGHAT